MYKLPDNEEIENYFKILKLGQENYYIHRGILYYVPYEYLHCIKKTKHGTDFKNRINSIIQVSDCYVRLVAVQPYLSNNYRAKYTVFAHIVPCKLKSRSIAKFQFDLRINNGKFSFAENKLVYFAKNNGFHIWHYAHFCRAVHFLLHEAFYNKHIIPVPFVFTGYRTKYYYAGVNNSAFLPTYPDVFSSKTSLDTCVQETIKYVAKHQSAGMIFLYSMLAVTHYLIGKYIYRNRYENDNNFYTIPVVSFNYYGDNYKAVCQDVNLFANFFKANDKTHMEIKYNITLDSANYCFDNYMIFEDVPLIVRRIRGSVAAKNRKLLDIISLRYDNYINFFPVIISKEKVNIAQVFSVKCFDNSILTLREYRYIKSCINTIFKSVVKFLSKNQDILNAYLYVIYHEDIDSNPFCNEYMDSILAALLEKALEVVCYALEQQGCQSYKLSKFLHDVLDTYMLDKTNKPPNVNYVDDSHIVNSVISFINDTYENHKNDVPQKTVWLVQGDNNFDSEYFANHSYDNRFVYISNKVIEDFIKNKLKQNPLKIKSFLYGKGIICRTKRGYTFKKHDKGEHLCMCVYAEYLNLSDS